MSAAAGASAVENGHWRPGSRVARVRNSHSYRSVLGLIMASFIYTAASPDEHWSQSVLVLIQCATLVLALYTAGLGHDFRPGLIAVAISVALAVVAPIVGGNTLEGLLGIVQVTLVAAAAAVIALGVFDQGEVNRQSVTGSICIYVLIGMLFTFVYGAVAALGSGSFFAQGTDGTPSLRLYFSYVTLATLGYGDYTPASALGHTLAVLEALAGQLYLVTVVAVLVAGLAGRRSTPT
jgi:Ion channel